ncbi:hypothetical protein NE865_09167 [Phthorimaea operculella]|nr:hypothetical protein NE865_09167 [Phthorimaea operculella]
MNVTIRKERTTVNFDEEDLPNSPDHPGSSLSSEIRLLREQVALMNSNLLKVIDSVERAHEKIDECSIKLTDIDERILNLESALSKMETVEAPVIQKQKRKRRKSTANINLNLPAPPPTNETDNKNSEDILSPDNEANSETADSIDDDDDQTAGNWIEYRGRKKRITKPIFQRGTAGPNVTTLRAVEPTKTIHLWNMHMESRVDEIHTYLKTLCGPKPCKVEELKARGAYKSFKLTVSEELFDKCIATNLWPNNARIKEWTPFRFSRHTKNTTN